MNSTPLKIKPSLINENDETIFFLLDNNLNLSNQKTTSINLAIPYAQEFNGLKINHLAEYFTGLYRDKLTKIINSDLSFETKFKVKHNSDFFSFNVQSYSCENGLLIVMNKVSSDSGYNSNIETLLYRITYDLRSPLTTILGILSVIDADKINDKETLAYLNMLSSKIDSMDQILNSIHDIIDVRYKKIQFEEFKIIDLIEEINQELNDWIIRNSVSITFNSKSAISIDTDYNLLKIIMIILIKSIIKFKNPLSPPNIYISVTNDKNNHTIITLNDSMLDSNSLNEQISFEEFYHSNTKDTNFGLELFFADTLVKKLNSEITFGNVLKDRFGIRIKIPNAITVN